jgi:hypothetical protein
LPGEDIPFRAILIALIRHIPVGVPATVVTIFGGRKKASIAVQIFEQFLPYTINRIKFNYLYLISIFKFLKEFVAYWKPAHSADVT